MGLPNLDNYSRKPPGLGRTAGLWDASFFGLMNNALPISIWMTLSGLAWFPGGNLLLASIITFLLVLFGYSLVWGILGGSMPRSGGSYVYNSRILHPMLGMIISFWNGAFIMLAWICVLAPWFWQIGMPLVLGALAGGEVVSTPLSSGWGLYLGTSLVNISAFLMVLGGMKNYFSVQRVLVWISLVAITVVGIIFARTSQHDFVALWDSFAAQRGGLTFTELIDHAAAEMGGIPRGWNWRSTLGLMLPVSWGLIYGYVVIFIGGEVKNPRVNILRSQVLTTVISGFFMIWIGLEYSRMLGWEGMHAVAWMAEKGIAAVEIPIHLHYISIASFLTGFERYLGLLLGISFLASNWLWVVFSYIAWSRAAMAWGKDRIAPGWFTKLSGNKEQPVLLLVAMLVVSQLALIYFIIYSEVRHSLSVGVMQLLSVFAFTALGCLVFPFLKKMRPIWNLSPYRRWKLAGIPMATLAGAVSLVLTGLLLAAFFLNDEFEELHLWWVIINIIVWVAGGLWYTIWKKIQFHRGLDVRKSFTEMPPE